MTRLLQFHCCDVSQLSAVPTRGAAARRKSTYIAIGGIFGVGLYLEWYHEQIIREKRDVSALPVEERTRRKFVRRAHLLAILAAWVIAVPATALLSGGLFLLPARVAGAG